MDKADEQIKGADRYIPTARAKILLLAIIPVAISVFLYLHKETSNWLPNWSYKEQTLLAISAALISGLLVAFLLVLELSIVCYQAKHGRRYHYTLHAPEMNIRWLYANARFRHYAFLVLLICIGVLIGYYL